MSNDKEIPEGTITNDPEGGFLYNGKHYDKRASAVGQYHHEHTEPVVKPNPADFEPVAHENGIWTIPGSNVTYRSLKDARRTSDHLLFVAEDVFEREQYRMSKSVESTPEQVQLARVQEAEARARADGGNWADPAVVAIYLKREPNGVDEYNKWKRNK